MVIAPNSFKIAGEFGPKINLINPKRISIAILQQLGKNKWKKNSAKNYRTFDFILTSFLQLCGKKIKDIKWV